MKFEKRGNFNFFILLKVIYILFTLPEKIEGVRKENIFLLSYFSFI